MCSFMRNVGRWTGFPACWVTLLKITPINCKLMNDHFSVSALVDTTCSHNWIVSDGGWLLKGDRITNSKVCAAALKGNSWGIAAFLYSSGGFQDAQHAQRSAVWSAHMQFPADFGIVLSYEVSPPARPGDLFFFVFFFWDIFWFLLTCYSKTQPTS